MKLSRILPVAMAALLALATAAPTMADDGAGNRVRLIDLRLHDVRSFVQDNPCTPAPDDTIELIGNVHVISQVVETPTGSRQTLVHFNQQFRGTDAAGLPYVVTFHEQNMATFHGEATRGTATFSLNIIGHGGTGNLVVTFIANTNGVTVDRTECRG